MPRSAAAKWASVALISTGTFMVSALALLTASPQVLLLALSALIGLFIVLQLPVAALPSVALVLFVLLPQQLLAGGITVGAAPSAVVLLLWLLRRFARGRSSTIARGAAARPGEYLPLIGGIVVLSWGAYRLGAAPNASYLAMEVNWLVAFALGAVVPLVPLDRSAEVQRLWRTWSIVTIVSAAYVLVEFLLQTNFLYGPLYEAVGRSVSQQWSGYRSHGSFGHPLYAATFFATSFALAYGRYITTRRGSTLWMAAALVGVVLTVSRSALIAVGVAAAACILASLVRSAASDVPRRRHGLAILGIAGLLIAATGVFQARVGSTEAAVSSQARDIVTTLTFRAAEQADWLGFGAGTADATIMRWNDQGYIVENSLLQLLLSLGVVGVAGVLLMLVASAALALHARNPAGFAAVVALGIAISGYNAIETLLPLHVVIGIVLMIASERAQQGTSLPVPSNATRGSRYGASPVGRR